MLFHKHAEETRWSVINPTIYARCFTATTRNSPRCDVCLASPMTSRNSVTDEGAIKGKLRNMEQTLQNLSPAPLQNAIHFSKEVCRKWVYLASNIVHINLPTKDLVNP